MKDLQKIFDRISEGSLTLDKARNELSKTETHSDAELYLKNNLMSRLSELLVRCVCLQDEIDEFINDGVILSPEDQTENLN